MIHGASSVELAKCAACRSDMIAQDFRPPAPLQAEVSQSESVRRP